MQTIKFVEDFYRNVAFGVKLRVGKEFY